MLCQVLQEQACARVYIKTGKKSLGEIDPQSVSVISETNGFMDRDRYGGI